MLVIHMIACQPPSSKVPSRTSIKPRFLRPPTFPKNGFSFPLCYHIFTSLSINGHRIIHSAMPIFFIHLLSFHDSFFHFFEQCIFYHIGLSKNIIVINDSFNVKINNTIPSIPIQTQHLPHLQNIQSVQAQHRPLY